MQDMESDETYTNLYDKDETVMKECQDEAMGDWEEMPPALQKARKKKEFTEETAKKYWKMRAADFVREKRASVLHNNREAKKQANRRANREGMATPPRDEPQEEKLKSRVTNMWWFEDELRVLDMRQQLALEKMAKGTQNMTSVRTHEYARLKDEKMTMIRMQQGMTVSKAGTEALAAEVTVNTCARTDRDWLEDVREKSAEREDFQEMVGEARKAELAENAAVGRVYVVMGEPRKIINAHEASTLGMDILLWRAQETTRKEILPDDIAEPEKRTLKDLKRIVETWLQYGELSIVSKRQTALHFAYGKRARTDVEPPWMVTMTMSDAKVEGKGSSFGKLVGQLVLGFEKRDAPMHIQRRMQKAPRPWSTGGRKKEESRNVRPR